MKTNHYFQVCCLRYLFVVLENFFLIVLKVTYEEEARLVNFPALGKYLTLFKDMKSLILRKLCQVEKAIPLIPKFLSLLILNIFTNRSLTYLATNT